MATTKAELALPGEPGTIRRDTFSTLTRRDRLSDVVAGLAAAGAAGMTPVKVNAVLMRGVNDDQAPALLAWCLERGYDLRFIEQMPLDAQHGWSRERHGHGRRDPGGAGAAFPAGACE